MTQKQHVQNGGELFFFSHRPKCFRNDRKN